MQAQEIFKVVQSDFPGARVFASSLDEYVAELRRALPGLDLPVVTQEIGDTWIHGAPFAENLWEIEVGAIVWCFSYIHKDDHPAFVQESLCAGHAE